MNIPGEEHINFLGYTQAMWRDLLADLGEKPFHASQLMKWIHHRLLDDFDEMTDISKKLRQHLSEHGCLDEPEVVRELVSNDETRKWLIRSSSGSLVETVFIPEENRGTLCVSSQVGCALDCSFCSTGKQGFNGNLTSAEIIGQVRIAIRRLAEVYPDRSRAVSNIVMMGMGEPLLNMDNVLPAVELMMDDLGYGISKRKVTVSTAGVVPGIEKLYETTDVSLAISLHAPNDELRNQLVPINKKYPIAMLLDSARRYLDKMPDVRRKITIEYTMMDRINDRDEHARELAILLKDIPCKINLIPFNPFAGSSYRRVTNTALNRFRDILHQEGYTVTVRTTRGDDIAAACGQLAGTVNDRTRRSQRYQQEQQVAPVRFVG